MTGDIMNGKTFLVAAGVSFIAALLTSSVARMDARREPLHLLHALASR
jgi:hypothetical protein